MAVNFCKPHRDRGFVMSAVKDIDGEPMCQNCIDGKEIRGEIVKRDDLVPSRKDSVTVAVKIDKESKNQAGDDDKREILDALSRLTERIAELEKYPVRRYPKRKATSYKTPIECLQGYLNCLQQQTAEVEDAINLLTEIEADGIFLEVSGENSAMASGQSTSSEAEPAKKE